MKVLLNGIIAWWLWFMSSQSQIKAQTDRKKGQQVDRQRLSLLFRVRLNIIAFFMKVLLNCIDVE